MEISSINRKKVQSRWNRLQAQEQAYISENKEKYTLEMAMLMGFLAGDGNILIGNKVSNFHHTIRFFPDHESLIGPFCTATKKVFNKVPKIQRLKGFFSLSIDSKIVVLEVLKVGSFGVMGWRVPYSLLPDKAHKREWLRAFFDCEGYITDKVIRIQTVNRVGMRQIQGLLDDFGIESKTHQYVPKAKNWNTNHILTIGKKESKKAFFEEIGFNHERKQATLAHSINIYKRPL